VNRSRPWLVLGALGGLLAVALGAFGAHGLKGMLDAELLHIFEKGVRYQAIHSLALLTTGLLLRETSLPSLHHAALAFTLGILLFSGSLYLLALTGNRSLGMITPLGGLSFLAGWLLLALGCLRLPEHP
jgi:uncharacterized membrane protein YgdD (TMEM256/DUF423 family)